MKTTILIGVLIALLLPTLASAETYDINIYSSDRNWLITTTIGSDDTWPVSIGQNEQDSIRFCLKYVGDAYEAYFTGASVSPTNPQGFYRVTLVFSSNRFSKGETDCYTNRFSAEFWNQLPKGTYSFDFPTTYCTRDGSPGAECERHVVSFTLPVEVLASCLSSRDSCCQDIDCLPYCEGLVWYSNGRCDAAGQACNYRLTSHCDSHNECTTDSCDDYSGCTQIPSGACGTEPKLEEEELPPETEPDVTAPEPEDEEEGELSPGPDITPPEPPVIAPTPPFPPVECTGDCELNGVCVGVGTTEDYSYCDTDGEWKPQKDENQFCQNTYECKNALCTDNLCRPLSHEVEEPKGIIARFLEWLGGLFNF